MPRLFATLSSLIILLPEEMFLCSNIHEPYEWKIESPELRHYIAFAGAVVQPRRLLYLLLTAVVSSSSVVE